MFSQWIKTGKIYFDRRMIVMTLLGFASGFPMSLVTSTLSLWLKKSDVSKETIGLFSLVKTPYSFKWLWAPVVDAFKVPFLWKLGRRRSWALVTQVLLLLSIIGMSQVNPSTQLYLLAFFAVLVVIASASQDIVLDAYRIEIFEPKEQGAGTAIFILGYRLGLLFSGAGALWMVGKTGLGWNGVYFIMALGSLVGITTILFIKEPKAELAVLCEKITHKDKMKNFFEKSVYEPMQDFMQRANWKIILLFVFLYKMSDAYMGPMAYPFYDDMGFSESQIATITKIYGMGATIIGGIIGGLIASRYSIIKTLLIGGILQGLSNLMFVGQAYAGNDVHVLMATISVENVAGGIGTAAFVAYLSSLCNVKYTATQYALLSSFMSLIRDVFSSSSGYLAAVVSWPVFFFITTLMAVPGLLLLPYIKSKEKN